MKAIFRVFLSICLICVIALSGYRVMQIQRAYVAEAAAHKSVLKYKPEAAEAPDGNEVFFNQAILDLQKEYPDAVGWLSVPYTGIDYPFVRAGDNSYYVRRDLNGSYALAGTVFLDCRNNTDFSDANNILYGHNMKNGSMFASLNKFSNRYFFEENKTGLVFLADKTYQISFFAYLVVRSDDEYIYDIPSDAAVAEAYLGYIKQKARHYREIYISPEDKIVTLSTCSYEFGDARMVLLGKLD